VNVSAREFTSSLPSRVLETLKRYGLEPSWLELEITESTLMHNIDRVIGIMDRLTAEGIALSLDDFGTGYSSLSYLKRFPIDTLKIDRSFTTGIPVDTNDCALSESSPRSLKKSLRGDVMLNNRVRYSRLKSNRAKLIMNGCFGIGKIWRMF